MSYNLPPMTTLERRTMNLYAPDVVAIERGLDDARAAEKDRPKVAAVYEEITLAKMQFAVSGFYRRDDSGAGWIDNATIQIIDRSGLASDITELASKVCLKGRSDVLADEAKTWAIEQYEGNQRRSA